MLESMLSIEAAALDRWSAVAATCRFGVDDSDADLLALVESAERLKDACAALQARATHEYSERRLAALTVGSRPDREARRDIAARIARARRVSPTHGSRYLELARMLVRDLPRTLEALADGRTTEHRASLVAHSAGCLGTADRSALDADLGPRLAGKGNRAVQAEAERIAAELDAPAVIERHRLAANDRRVTLRPAPDTMTYLTALLPVTDGVAAWATLDRHATLAKAGGDRRTRGQIMADELGHRLLYGTISPTDSSPTGLPVVPDSTNNAPPADAPACRVPAPESGVVAAPQARDDDAGSSGSDGHADVVDRRDDVGAPSPGTRVTGEGGYGDEEIQHRTRGSLSPGGMSRPRPWPEQTGGSGPTESSGPPPKRPPLASGPNGDHVRDAPVGPETRTPVLPPVRQIDLMLVMTDRTLLDGADTAAVIPGHGPVPAALARGMLADADPATRVFLRRLYTDPTGDHLLSADARGRLFPPAVRQFVLARDHRCRTPFCDAPIRHIDHTVPHSAGGSTSLRNNGGLCERCSLTKAARTDSDVQHGPPPAPPRSTPWDAGRPAAVGVP